MQQPCTAPCLDLGDASHIAFGSSGSYLLRLHAHGSFKLLVRLVTKGQTMVRCQLPCSNHALGWCRFAGIHCLSSATPTVAAPVLPAENLDALSTGEYGPAVPACEHKEVALSVIASKMRQTLYPMKRSPPSKLSAITFMTMLFVDSLLSRFPCFIWLRSCWECTLPTDYGYDSYTRYFESQVVRQC